MKKSREIEIIEALTTKRPGVKPKRSKFDFKANVIVAKYLKKLESKGVKTDDLINEALIEYLKLR